MHVVVVILRVILWLLLGALALILLTPIGADLGYEDGVIRVSAKVWGLKLQLLPKPPPGPEKPKKEKPKKEKKPDEPQEQKPRKKRELPVEKDELFDLLLKLLKTVLRGFGRFGRKFKIDRFRLVYLAAGRDPYAVALSYGRLNAALYSLAPLCEKRFAVRDCEVYTAIDFTEDWPRLDCALAFSIRVGQILGTLLSIGFGALRILVPAILRKKRAAKRNPPPPAEAEPAEDTESEQTDDTQTEPDTTEEEHHG